MQIGYKMPGCLKQTLGLVISAILILMTWNEGLAAEIAIERNEFVNLLANVKILKENLSSADRQITLYKRLDVDQKRLILLHSDRIKELEKYIASSDNLSAEFKETMEKTELVLDEADRNLKTEKRLSRYKTYAIIGGALVWLLW